MESTTNSKQSPGWLTAGILLFLLVVAAYGNSLRNDFLIDDYDIFLSDTKVHNAAFLPYLFVPDAEKVLNIQDSPASAVYRPLARLIPAACFLMFRENPVGYHLVNLALFYLCGMGIYGLVRCMTGRAALAFLTAALYAVHPIHGMIVNYITASIFAVQILALTGSLWTCWKAAESARRGLRLASLFLFLMSLFCHETSLVFPLYVFGLLWMVMGKGFREALARSLPYAVIAGVYLAFRMTQASLKSGVLDNLPLFGVDAFGYLASFSKLVFWYAGRLVTLNGIVMIWVTPPVHEEAWLWIFALAAAAAGCVILLFRWGRKDLKSFALLWGLAGFAPVTAACLFRPDEGFAIEPHWMFFANIGFFLLAAAGLTALRRTLSRISWLVLAGGLLLILMASTMVYNHLWGHPVRYCQYWLNKAPTMTRAYLADAYLRMGDFKTARAYYLMSLRNEFHDWQIYSNLGSMELMLGRPGEAAGHYRKALEVNPHSALTFNNLGVALLQSGAGGNKAEEAFQKSLELNSYLVEPRLNLAGIYAKRDDPASVVRQHREILALVPWHAKASLGLLKFYLSRSDMAEAVELGQAMLRDCRDPGLLVGAGNLFAAHPVRELAIALYSRAIEISPGSPEAYLEWGKVYGNAGKFDEAVEIWREGLRRSPADQRFGDLMRAAEGLKAKAADEKSSGP
ncbi:MAG: tetratricopeptide repeat protein [Candidatus Omnitrophota bacterium]|nr:tetratricopeptide repeat protein [Candidatus Omnitrophota bacterium]